MAEAAKQDLQKRMNEGKIEEAMTKKEREAQEMVRIGGGKKKNQRKPKANDNQYAFEFNIDIMVIKKFGLIQVSPPINIDDLDTKIAEI